MVTTRSGRGTATAQGRPAQKTNTQRKYARMLLPTLLAVATATGGHTYWHHTAPNRQLRNLHHQLQEARANRQFACNLNASSVACKTDQARLDNLQAMVNWVADFVAVGMTKKQALQAIHHLRMHPSGHVSRNLVIMRNRGRELRQNALRAQYELEQARERMQRALAQNKNSKGAVKRHTNYLRRQTIAPPPKRNKGRR